MSPTTAPTSALSDAPLGEVTRSGDSFGVVFRRHFRAPVEKVWAALTIPERLADWFAEAVVDLRVGGTISLDWGGDNQADMRVTLCDPPRSLAWVWTLAGNETLVRFDLAPDAGGTALTLTHSGVPITGGSGVRAGWHAHLEALPDAIEGRRTSWETKTARQEAVRPAYPALSA